MNKHSKSSSSLYLLVIAGCVIILSGVLNYLMNADEVSLGILFFAGIGFILLGIKPRYSGKKSERLNKYIRTVFFVAFIILIYWFIFGYLKLFNL